MSLTFRFIAITLVMAPVGVQANSWSCTHNDLVRTVNIEYADADGGLPCQVNYTKDSEGVATQSLWSADSQQGYCEEKAEEFIAKLSSWGWECSPQASATTEPEGVSESDVAAEPEVTAEPAAEPGVITESEAIIEQQPGTAAEQESVSPSEATQ